MKKIPWIMLILVGLLLTLVTPAGASLKGYHRSGIVGQVTGFSEPYQYLVVIYSSEGRLVTRLVTQPGGAFTVGLKPGTYVLTPFLSTGGRGSPALQGLHTTVTVVRESFAEAVLPFFLPY